MPQTSAAGKETQNKNSLKCSHNCHYYRGPGHNGCCLSTRYLANCGVCMRALRPRIQLLPIHIAGLSVSLTVLEFVRDLFQASREYELV